MHFYSNDLKFMSRYPFVCQLSIIKSDSQFFSVTIDHNPETYVILNQFIRINTPFCGTAYKNDVHSALL